MIRKPIPENLTADAHITETGIDIVLSGDVYPITYPKAIWEKTTPHFKAILADTLCMASTLYVPQILGKREIHYKTGRPLSECFFLRNGVYDAPYCANVDGKSSQQYLRDFFNTRYLFENEQIKTPPTIRMNENRKNKRALILFSFGKESLLSYALCKEIGIEPILVTIIHPGFIYEWQNKKPLVEKFEKEFGITVHTIDYQPGWLKEGKLWGTPTELGWGLHVTEYALLALPFAEVFDADFIVCGNEQSCNDIYYDEEDVLIYRAGLDQHREWTKQQGLLQSLLIGRSLPAYSLLEPLYEISETKILHNRYPEIGKYQMSCFASAEGAKSRRWCQSCEKCAYMYALCKAFGISTEDLGFTEDLFDAAHAHLYEPFFTRTDSTHYYGSQGELGLGFYGALKRGITGHSAARFERELLPKFTESFDKYRSFYMGIHPTEQMPENYKEKLLSIFSEELSGCLER